MGIKEVSVCERERWRIKEVGPSRAAYEVSGGWRGKVRWSRRGRVLFGKWEWEWCGSICFGGRNAGIGFSKISILHFYYLTNLQLTLYPSIKCFSNNYFFTFLCSMLPKVFFTQKNTRTKINLTKKKKKTDMPYISYKNWRISENLKILDLSCG